MDKIIWFGNVMPTKTRRNPNQGRVYDSKGLAPTLTNLAGGGNLQPMVVERKQMNKLVCERRMDEGLRTFKDDVIGTIRTIDAGGVNE